MTWITYPIASGTRLAVLPITGGNLALSALALSDGTPIDPRAVTVQNFPGTQTVSGSVTAAQGTKGSIANAWPVAITADGVNIFGSDSLPLVVSIAGAVPIDIGSALPAGTNAIGSVSVSNFPGTQPVSGTVTANQGAAGGSAWPVSIASLPAFAATPTVNLGTIGSAATEATQAETHATLGSTKYTRVLLADANGNPLGIGGTSSAFFVQDATLDGVVGNLGSAWGASHPSVVVGVQTSGGAIGGLTTGAHGGLVVEGVASGTVIPVAYASTPTVNAAQSGTWTVGITGTLPAFASPPAVTASWASAQHVIVDTAPTTAITNANLDAALSTLAKESGGNLATLVSRTPALGPVSVASSQPITIGLPSNAAAATWPVAGSIIKSGAGAFYYFEINNTTGGAVFLMVFDAAALPSTSDDVGQGLRWVSPSLNSNAQSTGNIGHSIYGVPFATKGIVVFSTSATNYQPVANTSVKVVSLLYA